MQLHLPLVLLLLIQSIPFPSTAVLTTLPPFGAYALQGSGTNQSQPIPCGAQAIRRAGASGDPADVVRLRRLQRDDDCRHGEWRNIILALAKQGGALELQRTWCEIGNDVSPEVAQDIAYIGGWFSIQAVLLLVEQQGKWEKVEQGDALIPGSPRTWALTVLARVVPNPPVFAVPDDRWPGEADPKRVTQTLEQWKMWIRDHRASLMKLKPTGDNVDRSPAACARQQLVTRVIACDAAAVRTAGEMQDRSFMPLFRRMLEDPDYCPELHDQVRATMAILPKRKVQDTTGTVGPSRRE